MRKIPLGVLFAGYLFVLFAIPAFGIDLLIDAVGYLIIFNALRFLSKLYPKFAPAVPVSLVLTLAAAAHLVLQMYGTTLALFIWLLPLLDAVLLALLLRGFAHMFHREGPKPALVATLVVFPANILWPLVHAAAAAGQNPPPAWPATAQLVLHLLLAAALGWFAFLPQPAPSTTQPGPRQTPPQTP